MLPDKEIEVWRWNLPVVEGDLNPVNPTSQCTLLTTVHTAFQGFPGGSVVKNLPASAGDVGSVPGLGRSPGEGNDNPLQYSCLGNLVQAPGQRSLGAAVPGVTKSWTHLRFETAAQLIYHAVLISGVREGDSVIHVHHPLLLASFPP